VIIHPFVQVYRQPLYQRLSEQLSSEGRELVVVWNPPAPRLAGRSDSTTAAWTYPVPTRWVPLGGREIVFRRLGGLGLGPADLVIVEQAVKNLETYPLLASGRRGGPGVAMWGHGRSYSVPQPAAIAAAKQWLTRRADWFFAYTTAGADHVIDRGFPAPRVTVLKNTIDTGALQADLAALNDVAEYRRRQGLTPGRTALFLGGVDRAKGIDFLLKSAQIVADSLPGFTLLVAGAGDELHKVVALEQAGGPVRALGRVDGHQKALALAACDVLAVPEWIGLVAVDSLVAGRPIVTTHHHSHSPESEYLHHGVTAVFSEHDPVSYAHEIRSLLLDDRRVERMQAACVAESSEYSLSRMVDSFASGIRTWDATRR
jgi:glycosyltransferase involved in cell wall biosynthesis